MTVGRKKHNRAAGQGCQPASHLTSDGEGRTRKILPEVFPVRNLLQVSPSTSRDWEMVAEAANSTSSPAETGGSKDTGVL